MNKKNIVWFTVLGILLVTSLYFNFNKEKTLEMSSGAFLAESKVGDLYSQMLPSLPAHDLYCIPTVKSYCSVDGCKKMEANVFLLFGKTKDSLFMARCDDKPCDTYDVNISQSGVFTDFETKEPHGLMFRTSNLNQSFTEVVTLGTDSFVSYGYCYLSKQN